MAGPADTQTPEKYIDLDTVSLIGEARHAERLKAESTMAERQTLIDQGYEARLPLPVDALSTANAVIATKQKYGENSYEYLEKRDGLRLDCHRLVAEWYRKKKREYFPAVRHVFDVETEDFYSHGFSLEQMTDNALRPVPDDPEETGRRINEKVENATPLIVRRLGGFALEGMRIRTVSECTDKAIKDYLRDKANNITNGRYGGYVPEIAKPMIRDMWLDPVTGDRFEEQLGLDGTYVNHWIFQEALSRRGIDASLWDKTDLHGKQLLVEDDLMEFVKLLDEVLEDNYPSEFFMGEPVEPGHPKDYENVRAEAIERQASLKNFADAVSLYVLDLAEEDIDRYEAPGMVEEFVKLGLMQLAKENLDLAEQIFDSNTAEGLREVIRLELIGEYEQAYRRMNQVVEQAPGGGFCGAGCGLEMAKLYGDKAKDIEELGFDPKKSLVDTERKCPKCSSKSVVYDLSKGKKGCTGCKATAKY